eukprot:TRINITY_DN17853_c0_g1_i2.p1 TRINITY_DN17853_c0_g1~~TRINITY_DN17853_c0_g1_i2.p1  ORF type:complete len:436 (-),score=99.66 TRINITY_DN17853_c0_g1_i2:103-1410(-)
MRATSIVVALVAAALFARLPVALAQCSFSFSQTQTNIWVEGGQTIVQYDGKIVNTGSQHIYGLIIQLSNPNTKDAWSVTRLGDGSYTFPSWTSSLAPGQEMTWVSQIYGASTFTPVVTNPAGCPVNWGGSVAAASASGGGGGGAVASGGGAPSGKKCEGNPPRYNGLPCASTTRYWDNFKGACGCGVGNGNGNPFSWQYNTYTAAASPLIFGSGTEWCGGGCGSCWQLTPTGDCPYGGSCAPNAEPITVMVTNLCPPQYNVDWCPYAGNNNNHGFPAHFDLMDYNMGGLITAKGWNNPIVTYKRVPCGGGGSAGCGSAAQCQCQTQGQCSQGTNYFNEEHADNLAPRPSFLRRIVDALSQHAIAGIAIAASVVAIVIGVGAFMVIRKRRNSINAKLASRLEPLLANEHDDHDGDHEDHSGPAATVLIKEEATQDN